MTDAAWVSFLDSLESELHAVRRNPASRLPTVEFVPPEGIGPLPRACEARARELLHDLESVTEQVHAEMRRTSKQLREMRHLDPRAPKGARRFDSRA